mgnify:CR=1 FL=1
MRVQVLWLDKGNNRLDSFFLCWVFNHYTLALLAPFSSFTSHRSSALRLRYMTGTQHNTIRAHTHVHTLSEQAATPLPQRLIPHSSCLV